MKVLDSKEVVVFTNKDEPKNKKKKKDEEKSGGMVLVGVSVVYDDGVRVVSPANGQIYIGDGTKGFMKYERTAKDEVLNDDGSVKYPEREYRPAMFTWHPAARPLTDNLNRPLTNPDGSVRFEKAEIGAKRDVGLPADKFVASGGFAKRVYNDLIQAAITAAEERAAKRAA